jgi:plasmid stabilization system protein ParE
MAKTIRIHPQALAEFRAAIDHYSRFSKLIAAILADRLKDSFRVIRIYPDTLPVLKGVIHRFQISRLPFEVLYRSTESQIEIMGLMHRGYSPEDWQDFLDAGIIESRRDESSRSFGEALED